MLSVEGFTHDSALSLAVLAGTGAVSLVGLAFNVLLLKSLWRVHESWGTFSFYIIACVAVSDISASLAILGTGVFRALLGFPGLLESAWYCRAFGFTLFLSYSMSGTLLSILSLNRYLLVVHQARLWPPYAWFALGVVSLVSAALLGYTMYNDAFMLDPTFSYCVPAVRGRFEVTSQIIIFLTNIPVIFVCFCYSAIFLVCWRIEHHHQGSPVRHLPLRALLVMLTYLICYTPDFLSIMWLLTMGAHPPFIFYILVPFSLSCILAINPILVVFLSKRVRHEVLLMFAPLTSSPKVYENAASN
ncbi:hypothetical protein DSO57_1033029 [Entomophthora muscae]|uniref:Uncharacterized protein n=1 Tax=Entomophthora muscae TaxID=34485 RepID=A0ACC2TB82_9FUNG|nr:hypothetical protein DSO57_1033029 [Entomophthora muscae]